MYRSLLLLSNSNCFIVVNKHDLILSYLILSHEIPLAICYFYIQTPNYNKFAETGLTSWPSARASKQTWRTQYGRKS